MKLQFPRPKDQAALQRKADSVRDRLLVDLRKKTKQAERMLGNAAPLSSSAKKKGREAEVLAKDSAKVRAVAVTTVASCLLGGPPFRGSLPDIRADYSALTHCSVGPGI